MPVCENKFCFHFGKHFLGNCKRLTNSEGPWDAKVHIIDMKTITMCDAKRKYDLEKAKEKK